MDGRRSRYWCGLLAIGEEARPPYRRTSPPPRLRSTSAEKPNRSFRLTIIRRLGRSKLSFERRKKREKKRTQTIEIKKKSAT